VLVTGGVTGVVGFGVVIVSKTSCFVSANDGVPD
jgi:hypothetical protein